MLRAMLALVLAAEAVSNDTAPDTWKLVLQLVLVTVAVFALAGYMFHAMRVMARDRDGRADAPGIRSVATFEVPGSTDDASRLAALADALAPRLAEHGVTCGPPSAAPDALFVPLDHADTHYVLRLERGPASFVATLVDRGAATHAVTDARHTPLAGPNLTRLLDALNRSLRKVPGLDGLRWHAREAWEAGQTGPGAHAPVDAR